MNNIASILFLFLVIFDPQVPFFPAGVGVTAFIPFFLVIPVLYKITHTKSRASFFLFKTFPYFILFGVLFLFIAIRLFSSESGDFSIIFSFFKAFLVFLSVVFVFLVFYADESPSTFFYALFSIFLMNSLINFVAASMPSHFEFLNLFREPTAKDPNSSNLYRYSFLSGSGYYSIGTAYGLMVLLVAFYVSKFRVKSLFFLLSTVVILLSGFIAARTSFFAIFSSFVYLSKASFRSLLILTLTFFLIFYILVSYTDLGYYETWMLSFFNFSENSSGSHLLDQMYFWPGDKVFLFGMAKVNDGSFPYTDSGYMQDLLFGGIIFVFLKTSYLFLFFKDFFSRFPFFVILVCFSILVFQFKGAFLYSNPHGMAVFYSLFLFMHSFKREKLKSMQGV